MFFQSPLRPNTVHFLYSISGGRIDETSNVGVAGLKPPNQDSPPPRLTDQTALSFLRKKISPAAFEPRRLK